MRQAKKSAVIIGFCPHDLIIPVANKISQSGIGSPETRHRCSRGWASVVGYQDPLAILAKACVLTTQTGRFGPTGTGRIATHIQDITW